MAKKSKESAPQIEEKEVSPLAGRLRLDPCAKCGSPRVLGEGDNSITFKCACTEISYYTSQFSDSLLEKIRALIFETEMSAEEN